MGIGQKIRAKTNDQAFRERFRLSDDEMKRMRTRPNNTFLSGVALIGLSFLFFAGGVVAASYASHVTGNPAWVVVGAPVAYLGSWGIFALGMMLTGTLSFVYLRLFLKWIIGRVLRVRHGDAAGSETSSSENRNV